MVYKILISEPTHADIDSTIGYIAVTLAAPRAAASLLDEYESALKLIADNPLLFGVDMHVSEALNMQIRRCPVKRYGIYYFVNESTRTVYVVGFAHALRDTPSLLEKRFK